MAKLKTLLVHPDPELRADLRRRLGKAQGLQVLGAAVSAFEALELLEAVRYGVFFLGVDLAGEMTGLELARTLSGRKDKPGLVFLAREGAGAYQAFELGALDYLIWPPDEDRFAKTLDKLAEFRRSFRLA